MKKLEIERGDFHVRLLGACRSEIPQISLIVRIMNTNLMELFDLNPCLAVEGGVTGTIEEEPIEIRNLPGDDVGLESEYQFEVHNELDSVLDVYEDLLWEIVNKPLVFEDKQYEAAALFALDDEHIVRGMLWRLIAERETPSNADTIFRRLKLPVQADAENAARINRFLSC